MTKSPDRVVLASRGSALALRQAEIVASLIRGVSPGTQIEVSTVTTTGDRDARPFAAIGGKGLFMAEVEREVAEGRADAAVHSAKDLTAELAPGCVIACVPRRGPVEDVVVGGRGESGAERLGSLAAGAVVGTSSMRRRALLAEARADLTVADLRGNLDTRLTKVRTGVVDAAVLADAGIERLGTEVERAPLDPSWWVPAPAQGALAVEALSERKELVELLGSVSDQGSYARVVCERAFGRRLEGGCSVPLGCLATIDDGYLTVTGYLATPDGARSLRDRISGPARQAEALGVELAEAILASGGDEILEEIRAAELSDPAPP